MKKLLFVLLASATISPAMAQTYNYAPAQRTRQPMAQTQGVQAKRAKAPEKYKLGNPLYRPAAQTGIMGGEIDYARRPKKTSIGQQSASAWEVIPEIKYGITDKLSIEANANYGDLEFKSGGAGIKGAKSSLYGATANLRYLVASVDNFDFNIYGGASYRGMKAGNNKMKNINRAVGIRNTQHRSDINVGLQVGKKIENVTPYFAVGFQSEFWSSRGNNIAPAGTNTVINPGIYIDLNEQIGLDLSYRSVVHENATYKAVVDFYPQDNLVVGVGAYMIHPQTDLNEYGALANIKVKF
ncbi:MAG: hypothetical protein J6Y03_01020 [Alphaproteobacteria bacterium]|nr:hypothetical protein [Alphaproteobacteria bacterium]